MSRFLLTKELLIVAAAIILADAARAELVGVPKSPAFTREEIQVIERNPALSKAIQADPWVVRRLFDATAAKANLSVQSAQPDGDEQATPPPVEESGTANPDLPRLQRASPEAINDLFQLLKLAGTKQQEKKR